MKKSMLIVVFFSLFLTNSGGKELIKNGNFDKSKMYWKGKGKVIEVDENKFLKVDKSKKKIQEVSQDIKTGGVSDLTLKFKYKTSADYSGRGLTLRFERLKLSYTYSTIDLKNDHKWNEYTWKFSQVNGAKKLKLSFDIMQGNGSVFLDDISVDGQ